MGNFKCIRKFCWNYLALLWKLSAAFVLYTNNADVFTVKIWDQTSPSSSGNFTFVISQQVYLHKSKGYHICYAVNFNRKNSTYSLSMTRHVTSPAAITFTARTSSLQTDEIIMLSLPCEPKAIHIMLAQMPLPTITAVFIKKALVPSL